MDDLDIMWSMLNGYIVNFAQFFLTQLAGQTKQHNGKITIGGLLMPIAISFSVDVDDMEPAAYWDFDAPRAKLEQAKKNWLSEWSWSGIRETQGGL